jgi:hypothetical protein
MHFAASRYRRGVASAIAGLALALLASRAVAPASAGALAVPPPAELGWSSVAVGIADDVATALALDRAGRLAVGDARGVVFGVPGSPMRRVALRGAVRDLAFFDDGTASVLLAATELGLYRISPEGRVESVAPRPGPEARAVARIAVAGGVVAIATAAGAFASADGTRWQRLSEELRSGPATAIALAARDDFVECWVAIRGELWRSEIRTEPGRVAATTPVRVGIPFASGQRPPIDIALDVGDAAVAVIFESELVIRGRADARWEQLRPTLPPGASVSRLAAALDRYWLATDRGLLVAANLHGPWRRAQASSGSAATIDLESDQGALYAATDDGIAVVVRPGSDFPAVAGAAQSETRSATAPEAASGGSDFARTGEFAQSEADATLPAAVPQPSVDPREPDIQSVHRAALRYLTLEPARIAALREGVSRRGWLPILSFHATRDRDRNRHSDYDENFVSGEMRQFNDHDSDRNHQLELQLLVSWDLADIAYHPESIDVSREAREIIELRDDVLDEITQLYFERRRVLATLAIQPDSLAASELQLRAAQLAAGIDAWTGGWFGRQVSDFTP